MFLSKLPKLNFIFLGAINGLILGIIPILPYAFACFNDSCKGYETLPSSGTIDVICVCKYVNWFLPLESLIIVASACFLILTTVYKRIKSEIVLWQIVGGLSILLMFFFNKLIYPFIHYWQVCYPENLDLIVCEKPSLASNLKSLFQVSTNDLIVLGIVFSVISIFNLLFAYTIRRYKVNLV